MIEKSSSLAAGIGIASFLFSAAFAGQARAQMQMPDPRQMSGTPLPVAELPDGTVSVRLIRGQLSNNISDHPVEMHGDGRMIATKRTDENGRAQFADLPRGARVHAVAVVSGERLESQSFEVPVRGGIRLMLVAAPEASGAEAARSEGAGAAATTTMSPQPGIVALGTQSRFVFEVIEDAVHVYGLLQIVNTARTPVLPRSDLVFALPDEAQGTTVLEDSTPQATAAGPRVTVKGPFPPGETPLRFAYQLPSTNGAVVISQQLPATLTQFGVVVQKIGDVRVSSPQLAEQRDVTADGETYILASGPSIPAGGSFQVELTGLPHHSPLPRRIALALAVAIMCAGAWASIGGKLASRRKKLETTREKLLTELARVEQQQRAGSPDRGRLLNRRHELVRQLERVYGELESVSS